MDFVGALNAYGSIPNQRKNKTNNVKTGNSSKTSNNNNGVRRIIKSASSASIGLSKPTTRSTRGSSVLGRNTDREGIYRYELSEPIGLRRGSLDQPIGELLFKKVKSNNEIKRSFFIHGNNNNNSNNTNISFTDLKQKLVNIFNNNSPKESCASKSLVYSNKNTDNNIVKQSSSTNIQSFQTQNTFASSSSSSIVVSSRSSNNNKKENFNEINDAEKKQNHYQVNYLKEPDQAPIDENEIIHHCTCHENNSEEVEAEYFQLQLVSESLDSTLTMPRNSNYYVHPQYTSPVVVSHQHQRAQAHNKCKIHFQNQNGHYNSQHVSSKLQHDYNQNHHQQQQDSSQTNGHHHVCQHHQQQLANGTLLNGHVGVAGNHAAASNSKEIKKEFIPSFVLLDATKSINERKIYDLVKKLSLLSSEEVSPIVNFQDKAGRTPLSYLCSNANVMMVEELSKLRRLDPNLADVEGNTPLHYAAQAGHSEVVDLMLSRFNGIVDPNCRNSTGLTPLMKAALQGRTRCTKSLISAGANPYLRDYSRQLTAEGWARLCGRHICAEVIVRSVKDYFRKHPKSSSEFNSDFSLNKRLPVSKSDMELKRMNSDESPYYHLYNARTAISGASWLKNKIKKAIGGSTTSLNSNVGPPSSSNNNNVTTGANANPSSTSSSSRPTPGTYALVKNLSNATICASSLLLPSIKPLLDDKQKQIPKPLRKMHIPSVQVTPVRR